MTTEADGHVLRPLLAPRTVVLVGASTREDSVSYLSLRELLAHGFAGTVYPVNPRYDSVQGLTCYPSIAELPEVPDLAILCVANERLEPQLQAAADSCVPAAVIFGSGKLAEDDPDRPLLMRLTDIALQAGIKICGGNCMGFRNLNDKTHVAVMSEPNVMQGPVTFISHSGTAYGQMLAVDGRAGYQLVVSAGQEHSVTVAEYMDYALSMTATRCIALFLETVRDPDGFVAALERARRQRVPVVALKVGRSAAAAKFAVTHSGALVGNAAAYRALFDAYGVIQVDHLGEMLNVIQLLCYARELERGGLAALMDSGGKRELMMDLVEQIGCPVASISKRTRAILADNLDVGLEPVNPLDFWGTARDWQNRVGNCAYALAEDGDTAICVLAGVICWAGSTDYVEILRRVAKRTEKPLAFLTEFLRAEDVPFIARLNEADIAVLVGEQAGLRAIERVMRYRRFLHDAPGEPMQLLDAGIESDLRKRLTASPVFDESQSLAMLREIGVPVAPFEIVHAEAQAVAAADRFGYPVVLKTAMPGVRHKSDVGGVKLGLDDASALRSAYRDLAARLGARALVSPQIIEQGVELAFGLIVDPVAGAVVMVSAGGTLIEMLDDKACALAPVSAVEAREMIASLAVAPMLEGIRGRHPLALDALAEVFAAFSLACSQLEDALSEIDVNPVLVTSDNCVALDALVVGANVLPRV